MLPLIEPLAPPPLLEQLFLEFLEGTDYSVEVLLREGIIQVFHEKVVFSTAIFDLPPHFIIKLELLLDHQLLLLAQDGTVHAIEMIKVLKTAHVHGGLGRAQSRRPRWRVGLLV